MSKTIRSYKKETHQVEVTTSKFEDMILISGNGYQWTGVKINLEIAVTLVEALSEYIKNESERK